MNYHNTASYLLNPNHPITVNVIGSGGTGTVVLRHLARINHCLLELDHMGIRVCLWDNDIVSPSNLGRQAYSSADIGKHKAMIQINRINRFYGFDWEYKSLKFQKGFPANITISCVDSIKSRKEISEILFSRKKQSHYPYDHQYYWLDIGNSKTSGQFYLGTVDNDELPSWRDEINNFEKAIAENVEDNEPSCSTHEALLQQDLFVNETMGVYACQLIWKMFREFRIDYRGMYLNLESGNNTKINI